jgi:tetratricopeptide (TPR) repeat protein
VLADRLGATDEACKQLERLVAELAPTDLDAHSILRRLYEARGDFQSAVRIAERELYLLAEPAAKIARALDIGVTCRDRIGDPARALQAYERVLAIDPHHDEALAAAAELHERLGDLKACAARARAAPGPHRGAPAPAARCTSGSPRSPPRSSAITRAA